MNRWLLTLVEVTESPMLALLLKVTLLLALGCAIAFLLRGRSAATRHLVWSLTLFGALIAAAIVTLAPPLEVPLTNPAPVATPEPRVILSEAKDLPPIHGEDPSPSSRLRMTPATTPVTPTTIWLVGVLALLAWSAIGHIGLALVARSATPYDDPLASGVRVALSPAVSAPVTWGFFRPIILLPRDADRWPADRRRAALLHELAHVKRHDYLIQLVASLACAIYWFHPLVWLAVRQLRSASEHACDDSVIAGGTEAPDYAAHLLSVARGAGARRFAGLPFLGMASHLEDRLVALLDQTRARSNVSRRARFAAAAVAVLLIVPLAAARPDWQEVIEAAKTELVTTDSTGTTEAEEMTEGEETVVTVNPAPAISRRSGAPVDQAVAASPGESLLLDFPAGATVDIRGWDEPRVSVRGTIGGVNGADTRVYVDRHARGVRVRSVYEGTSRSSSTNVQLQIRVPRRYDVELKSAGGGVTIVGVEGTFEGTTGGGEIILRNVKGEAELTTGGGRIDVTDVDLDGKVSTGGGGVTLKRVRGNLVGSSGSGPVIRDEENAENGGRGSRVRMTQAGGDIEIAEVPGGASLSTGGGDIDIGRGAGLVEASTGGGDIRIGPIAGSVRAGTGAGKVDVIIDDANGAAQTVHVTTGSGRVTIELPASFDGRFELESAYTENFHRRTQIDSDWSLQIEETKEWDATEGTPRRYIRGRGTAGSGRGLVRVRAVNGDVVVRRR
ncbi:MAG TPA: M56 family metallopeptidase [Thermoanaerobaculia bacterium]|nr:M56 family metallopeptidase [Thermoanaerobaculia bacterium]